MNHPPATPAPSTRLVESNGTPLHARLAESIFAHAASRGIALIPFVTAGYPSMSGFEDLLMDLAPESAAIEIGVPFSDPMADGVTIQRSSRAALAAGVSLSWILETLRALRSSRRCETPLVLMSYLNPLLALGPALAPRCRDAGVTAIIVPDLPLEEREVLSGPLQDQGVGMIQMATPLAPSNRLAALGAATQGFLYAVTMTGVTGQSSPSPSGPAFQAPVHGHGPGAGPLEAYLAACRGATSYPVAAGFGVRDRQSVSSLRGSAHAAIVGSALVEALERGESACRFLEGLRD